MANHAATFLDVVLADPDDEEAFLAWWERAVELLGERAHLAFHALHVVGRGRYVGVLGFPLPGGFALIRDDRRWHNLEHERPPARVEIRDTRPFHRRGNPRDLTTSELRRWLAERAAGRRDFVLLDVLAADSFAKRHIPGAVNLPGRAIDADSARHVIGQDLDRPVVVYCSGYG